MKIVVDANIIFSALIKGNQVYIKILNNSDAPDFIFVELEKYENRILRKVSNRQKMKKIIHKLFKKISIIPKIGLAKTNIRKAYNLCKDIDEKDTPYVALALELDAYLWTNDKKLENKLKEKGFSKILTTEELVKLIEI
ncbi:PIN domain-containing protein [Persephonella sp.]|uniref:PIN domain-containing protein n=1 Tax=Persephonella sp. TaxID=2060922 RepID=UPI002639C671|nr:PIN domain-containing protein [Persephonella sp.]